MRIKRTGGRTPVVIAKAPKGRRRLLRPRGGLAEAEALTGPLPGSMLVLLSRLHRSERPPIEDEEQSA
ncbi:hypothetical protein G3T14_14255 [Methylobacterium sp. BTF04]|uniref:hypothetical protein n=1 Tax=Methylobacterium sp. BTF04 TaxID=2708300 RepID=UPI0013D59B52|nr:hypothetical protein [Methylobacterium sp. BTF04]NEU13284.1 hypothetical protein [Methylobacterium sp. BTF04]